MKWTFDKTGRFPQRPYYPDREIDRICEQAVREFMTSKYGRVNYPISTDDLTIMVEQHVQDLDLYADLSHLGDDVEGVTQFLPSDKPRMSISVQLQAHNRENRLRTTITHELGHVLLHRCLWSFDQLPLFAEQTTTDTHSCQRNAILSASSVDWLEWQAGYASGALLMPFSTLTDLVDTFAKDTGTVRPFPDTSAVGRTLIEHVRQYFRVSYDAARVRLLQLKHLTDDDVLPRVGPSLFD